MEMKIFKGFLGISLAVLLLLLGVYWFQKSGSSEAAVKSKIYLGPAELNFSDSNGSIREYVPPSQKEDEKQDGIELGLEMEATTEASEVTDSATEEQTEPESEEAIEVTEPEDADQAAST